MSNHKAEIDELSRRLASAKAGVAFTGAGISTEAGIPDFRSPGGQWAKNSPIDFEDFLRSAEMRRLSWRRRFEMEPFFAAAEPTAGHRVLAKLVRAGALSHVITQNIDNLHQASGLADDQIIELHGNTTYATCLNCAARVTLDWVRSRLAADGTPPDCAACGGLIKAATISFGQSMPQTAMAVARAATIACDIFLAIGSSLVVYPAASFPVLAKEHGAALVIINREATPLDAIADLVIQDEIGPVMSALRLDHF